MVACSAFFSTFFLAVAFCTATYGINTAFHFPLGVQFSARGEYEGGHYMYDGAGFNAVQRSVRWPASFKSASTRPRPSSTRCWTWAAPSRPSMS